MDERDLAIDTGTPSPWRSRDFRLVWGGGLLNQTGDWLLLVALPIHVFIESESGSATAVLFVVELLAALLLGPVAGAMVDRWDLRRTLVATNLAQTIALAPLLFVTGDRIWPAYVVVGVQAMLAQINDPASVALLPRIVTSSQLTAANAVNSTSQSLARLIGSPLGGLAVGFGGIEAVIAIDAVTFAAVAIATVFVRADTAAIKTDAATGEPVTRGVRAGVRAIRERRSLWSLILIDSFGQIAQGFFLVLIIVFAVQRLDGGGVEVGVIRASMAVGAIIGAAAIGRVAKPGGAVRLLIAGYVGVGVLSFVFWNGPAVTTALWPYLVVFGLVGVPGAALGVGYFTAIQQRSPVGMLGRVVGTASALDALARGAGSLIAGALISRVELIVLLDIQAAIYLTCGGLAYFLVRDRGLSSPSATEAP